MSAKLEKYKGIHPGFVLKREIAKRALSQSSLARAIAIDRQTLNAIIHGKRSIPISVALKIEKELAFEEGSIAILQTYYDLEKEKNKLPGIHADLKKLRKSLFWDTDPNAIDWEKQSGAIIRRVFERGNEREKNEIIRFYGKDRIEEAVNHITTAPMKLYKH
jgi:addiction module HigA family antidote